MNYVLHRLACPSLVLTKAKSPGKAKHISSPPHFSPNRKQLRNH